MVVRDPLRQLPHTPPPAIIVRPVDALNIRARSRIP